MSRIFHARITLGQYLFILLVAGVAFWALWDKQIVIALVMAGLLIVGIEKLTHTTYTITADGHLVLYYGRLVHHEGKTEALMPVKEDEFIEVIHKRKMT